jgi:putative phosphoribosyl transferase
MQQALHETHPEQILIPVDHQALPGELHVPAQAIGLVIFAHGSGSSRLSPRNTAVASSLNNVRLATLLFDLLTPTEDRDFSNRFDIDLLASRLVHVVRWMKHHRDTTTLPIGLFGASTGAAAALKAAALDGGVQAVVSRGGRPDLAGDTLSKVSAPTLLLVGGRDAEVEELNRNALAHMTCIKKISIVPHATHLFEEPGALEEVARQTANWFVKYLP